MKTARNTPPYRQEELEDLAAMMSQEADWRDGRITIRIGRIELIRLFATALQTAERRVT